MATLSFAGQDNPNQGSYNNNDTDDDRSGHKARSFPWARYRSPGPNERGTVIRVSRAPRTPKGYEIARIVPSILNNLERERQ